MIRFMPRASSTRDASANHAGALDGVAPELRDRAEPARQALRAGFCVLSSVATAPTQRDTDEPAPRAVSGLARGSVLGRYVLLELLGEGGMGTVFVAHDGALDRNVAIKIVRHEAGREAQARLVQEAKAM